MVQRAAMIRVMIASPGDVGKERQLVRDVIHEWNAIHAQERSAVLLPVGWETDSFPDMGGRAQEIISKQIAKDCDLLVGVFWTRVGSPTGEFASGTVEEIEEHMSAGKPAMLYFSSAPVVMDSVDQDNYTKLQEFKKSCYDRGLVHGYGSLTEFRQQFSRHLAQTVISKFGAVGETINESAPDPPRPSPLTVEAQALLEAAATSDGTIMLLATLGGTLVEAGGQSFVQEGSHRSEALWRSAVEELLALRLVEDRGGKGELFSVTNAGYKVVTTLEPRPASDPAKISIGEPYEIRSWSKALGCTEAELLRAVNAVGNSAEKVVGFLRMKT